MLHMIFVIITGQIRPDESVFTYPEGNTALDFAFPDHTPEFLNDVVATASVEVLTACGDSVQCIFDTSQTGDISIGLETKLINEANVAYRQQASRLTRIVWEAIQSHVQSQLVNWRCKVCFVVLDLIM